MAKLSKTEFNRAIEEYYMPAEAVPPGAVYVQPYPHKRSRGMSKWMGIALAVALGIGAGWIGGKALNGRQSESEVAVPVSSDAQPVENDAQPQPESRGVKRSAAGEKPSTQSAPDPEVEQALMPPEPRSKAAAPPQVPRVEKDEETEKPVVDDASKDAARESMKSMSKEIKKMKRSPANKNENDEK